MSPRFQLLAVTADWLVDSIDGVTNSTGLSKAWVGLILLPIIRFVSEAVERATVVWQSVKDKQALCLEIAVESSIVSISSTLCR